MYYKPEHHYVYYLHDPETEVLLYIGRSINPIRRKKRFNSRTGLSAVMGICQRFSSLVEAQTAELVAIKKHKPPFNKYVVSGLGTLGQHHTENTKRKLSALNQGKKMSPEIIEKIRQCHLGRKNTEETKRKMSIAAKARKRNPLSSQTKARISQALLGRKLSLETKVKISLGQYRRHHGL